MSPESFDPVSSVTISCTDSPVTVSLPSNGETLRIRNYGPNRVFVKRGRASVVASASGYPIEAYTAEDIYRDINLHEAISAVCENSGETAEIVIATGFGE